VKIEGHLKARGWKQGEEQQRGEDVYRGEVIIGNKRFIYSARREVMLS